MGIMDKPLIVSLGGSLLVPEKIDVEFLKKFRELVLKHVDQRRRFLIVVGGGKTCRIYQDAAREIAKLADEDIDWIRIHVTHLNAQLVRSTLREKSHLKVLTHYDKKELIDEPVAVAAGWKPGHSTDYDAVMFARLYEADSVINLSDVPFVYDKDPDKFPDAEPFKNLSWESYRKMAGERWDPGKHLPFDPIAAKAAQEYGLKVIIMNGHDLENFENYLNGQKFAGTIISL